MFRLGTPFSGGAGGAYSQFKFQNFREKFLCAAIILHISYPWQTTPGSGAAIVTLIQMLASALGVFTLSYGSALTYKPYAGVTGPELRTIHRAVTQREVGFNVFGSGATFSGLGFQFSLPSVTGTVTCDIIVPFVVHPLADGRTRLPGWTQMRTMQIDAIEGPSFSVTNGTLTVSRNLGANCTIDVDVACYPSEKDQWSPLLSFYKVNNSDLEVNGPDGTHLIAWDDNSNFAGSALTVFSLYIDGKPLVDTAPPYSIDDRFLDYWVDGGSAIDDSETILYTPEWGQRMLDLPAGKITFRQPTQYVTTLKLRGLYWPVLTEAEAKEAATTAASAHNSAVLLTGPDGAKDMPAKVARSNPAIINKPEHPDFTLRAGILVAASGVSPILNVPQHIKDSIAAATAVGSTSGESTGAAAQAAALTSLAKQVPGLAVAAANAPDVQTARKAIMDHFARNDVQL